MAENKNKNGHSCSAEKRKRKSPDNISVFSSSFFHTFSHQVSPTMRCQYLVQFHLFAGGPCWRIPLSSCRPTVYRYLCGIFLDGISTREQFAFLVYCYRVKAIFHVLYWRQCGLTNSPIVKYPFSWGWCAWSAEGSLKQWLLNGKLLLLCLTKCHGVPCSLASRIATKVLKNCKTFSLRPRPRPNVQDQDFMIQDQGFHFCARGASRPRLWSRGLHHCFIQSDLITSKNSL